jgi:transcriptional regulator GlxA family with amidase domain
LARVQRYDGFVPTTGDALRIAVYAFDGVTMFHLSVPQLVFDEVARQGLGSWETVLFSDRAGSIRTAEGYTLGQVRGPAAAEEADVVVVPSWYEDGRAAGSTLQRALTRAHGRGATVAGLCLGAVAVADAGLLSRRAAVTHWQAVDMLAARHPDVDMDASVLYIDHGDVLTSAGTASAIDACLHFVRSRLGAAAANQVARSLVVAPHREGGQAQYIERPLPPHSGDDPIAGALEWALQHLAEPLTVDRLAAVAHLSRRTFIPSVPGFHRGHSGRLGQASATRRGPSSAGVDGTVGRPGRCRVRLRQQRHTAAELRRGLRHLAVGVPPTVRHAYRRQSRGRRSWRSNGSGPRFLTRDADGVPDRPTRSEHCSHLSDAELVLGARRRRTLPPHHDRRGAFGPGRGGRRATPRPGGRDGGDHPHVPPRETLLSPEGRVGGVVETWPLLASTAVRWVGDDAHTPDRQRSRPATSHPRCSWWGRLRVPWWRARRSE